MLLRAGVLLEKPFLLGVASPEGVHIHPRTFRVIPSWGQEGDFRRLGEGQSVLSCTEILKQHLKGTPCHLPRGELLSFHA